MDMLICYHSSLCRGIWVLPVIPSQFPQPRLASQGGFNTSRPFLFFFFGGLMKFKRTEAFPHTHSITHGPQPCLASAPSEANRSKPVSKTTPLGLSQEGMIYRHSYGG